MRKRVAVFSIFCAVAALGVVGSTALADGNGNWLAWGRTPDQLRHSPLTLITKSNVDQLGRIANINLPASDPGVPPAEPSYPLVSGDRLYMTTNDNNAWALDATTGRVIWRYKPDNVAVFR